MSLVIVDFIYPFPANGKAQIRLHRIQRFTMEKYYNVIIILYHFDVDYKMMICAYLPMADDECCMVNEIVLKAMENQLDKKKSYKP